MLEAGEDVRFLCRRLVILASEDIGNADPHALPLAVATMQACEFVGLPECQLSLSQCVCYLACAPKSNAATLAIGEASRDVREARLIAGAGASQGFPLRRRETARPRARVRIRPRFAEGIVAQDYLGVDREYYRPVPRGFEAELTERLKVIRARLRGDSTQSALGIYWSTEENRWQPSSNLRFP